MDRKLAAVLAFTTSLLLLGCPQQAAVNQRPAEALRAVLDAAKKGDVETFKKGLSRNFIGVVEEYQASVKDKPKLKGAFDWSIFMNSIVYDDPQPQEEIVKGNKAIVNARKANGGIVKTNMVNEDGVWKVAVPPGMVTGLDHFEDMEKMVKGEEVKARPNIPTGGGGKADRAKNLPADASDADRKRASALDTFDLGDLNGAVTLLADVFKTAPDDEEVAVALGRAYVQTGKSKEALELFETFTKKHPNSHRAFHYAGMAYMLNGRPADAAKAWQQVIVLDGTYAAKYKLDKRIQAAQSMAKAPKNQPSSKPSR